MPKVRGMASADGHGMAGKCSMKAFSVKINIKDLADISTFTVFATKENFKEASERVKAKEQTSLEFPKKANGRKTSILDLVSRIWGKKR